MPTSQVTSRSHQCFMVAEVFGILMVRLCQKRQSLASVKKHEVLAFPNLFLKFLYRLKMFHFTPVYEI